MMRFGTGLHEMVEKYLEEEAKMEQLFCPECYETARAVPPTASVNPGDSRKYSHKDGEPLCPVMGAGGYVSAEPVRKEDLK